MNPFTKKPADAAAAEAPKKAGKPNPFKSLADAKKRGKELEAADVAREEKPKPFGKKPKSLADLRKRLQELG